MSEILTKKLTLDIQLNFYQKIQNKNIFLKTHKEAFTTGEPIQQTLNRRTKWLFMSTKLSTSL